MIFISHATPEDNEFARWLALRLAVEGYPTWCDLTKLLGGEDFWADIEDAIRNRTTKFLYILTRASNKKQGVLQELAVAKQVARRIKDFVIPLKLDDLPHGEINIELNRLNAIDFTASWSNGLSQLLKKFEEDSIAKDSRFNPSSVSHWWREHMKARGGVANAGEALISNWFMIGDLPEWIWLHSLEGRPPSGAKELEIGSPNYRFKSGVFTFENRDACEVRLKKFDLSVVDSQEFLLRDFEMNGVVALGITRNDARNMITNLLRRAFEMACLAAGLKEYVMANDAKSMWFPDGFSDGNKVHYTHSNGQKSYRQMVGYKTLQPKDGKERLRTWHFGVQGKVVRWPDLVMAIKAHIVFSEDGELYTSKTRQHKARRGQSKMWHNDTWRDRMLAAMAFLADPACHLFITVSLGSGVGYTIRTAPIAFESPVSFEDPQVSVDSSVAADVLFTDADDEDEDEDDELEEER